MYLPGASSLGHILATWDPRIPCPDGSELAPEVSTVLFKGSTLLNTNCATGMHTLRLEEWPTHYYSRAMCGYRCEKNLNVQAEVPTRVCMRLLLVLVRTKSVSKRGTGSRPGVCSACDAKVWCGTPRNLRILSSLEFTLLS